MEGLRAISFPSMASTLTTSPPTSCAARRPGWRERVTVIELAPGLDGHFLDAHDIAYNKLWAGRPKDILWVRGLLAAGVIRLERLLELHEGNPIAEEDAAKVRHSLEAVTASS